MKNFMFFLVCLTYCTFGFAKGSAFNDITTLPSHWEGTGGDLFQRYSVQLDLQKVTMASSSASVKEYAVEGNFQFGSRSVRIAKISVPQINLPSSKKINFIEMIVFLNDELIPSMLVRVSADDQTGSLKMEEIAKAGLGKRFTLHSN